MHSRVKHCVFLQDLQFLLEEATLPSQRISPCQMFFSFPSYPSLPLPEVLFWNIILTLFLTFDVLFANQQHVFREGASIRLSFSITLCVGNRELEDQVIHFILKFSISAIMDQGVPMQRKTKTASFFNRIRNNGLYGILSVSILQTQILPKQQRCNSVSRTQKRFGT